MVEGFGDCETEMEGFGYDAMGLVPVDAVVMIRNGLKR